MIKNKSYININKKINKIQNFYIELGGISVFRKKNILSILKD